MTLEIQTYQRDTVEAVQVTSENYRDVAEWCGAHLRFLTANGNESGDYEDGFHHMWIQNPNVRKSSPQKCLKARIGDWVIKHKKGFAVFRDRAFQNNFRLVVPSGDLRQADPTNVALVGMTD